jgi:hypothetical protein
VDVARELAGMEVHIVPKATIKAPNKAAQVVLDFHGRGRVTIAEHMEEYELLLPSLELQDPLGGACKPTFTGKAVSLDLIIIMFAPRFPCVHHWSCIGSTWS